MARAKLPFRDDSIVSIDSSCRVLRTAKFDQVLVQIRIRVTYKNPIES